MKPDRPGAYIGRDGELVVIESYSTGSILKWWGTAPGLTHTWWHADGRHNLYRNHDIMARADERAREAKR